LIHEIKVLNQIISNKLIGLINVTKLFDLIHLTERWEHIDISPFMHLTSTSHMILFFLFSQPTSTTPQRTKY